MKTLKKLFFNFGIPIIGGFCFHAIFESYLEYHHFDQGEMRLAFIATAVVSYIAGRIIYAAQEEEENKRLELWLKKKPLDNERVNKERKEK